MPAFILVGLGGALGAMLRYGVSLSARRLLAPPFFYAGTLIANLLGCLLIGVVFGWVQTRHHPPVLLQVTLQVGLLGGFTTFSSFGLETLQLWRDQSAGLAIGYAATSLLGGIALVALGLTFARSMWGN